MKVIFPLLFLLSFVCQAAPDSLQVIEPLDTEWMVYRDSTYQPFVPGISSGSPRALHLLIDPDQPNGTRLRVRLPEGSVLMSNQQVMQVYDKAQTAHISLDSLAQYLVNGNIWVTIFNNRESLQQVSASLVRKKPAAITGAEDKTLVARARGNRKLPGDIGVDPGYNHGPDPQPVLQRIQCCVQPVLHLQFPHPEKRN